MDVGEATQTLSVVWCSLPDGRLADQWLAGRNHPRVGHNEGHSGPHTARPYAWRRGAGLSLALVGHWCLLARTGRSRLWDWDRDQGVP